MPPPPKKKIQHSTKKQYVMKVMLTSTVVSEFISVKVCCISGYKTKDFCLMFFDVRP